MFGKAVLFADNNAAEAARVRAALEKAGIAFTEKVKGKKAASPAVRMPYGGRTGNFTSGYSVQSSIADGTPQSWYETGNGAKTHVIYVKKKDFEKAKELI